MPDRAQSYTMPPTEVAEALVEGEAIVMNLADGSCYTLSGASAFAWELLHEGNTLGQVAAALTRTFAVNLQRAEADLCRLADQLLEEGLLVPVSEAHPEVRTPGLAARPREYQPLQLHKYLSMADGAAWERPGSPSGSRR